MYFLTSTNYINKCLSNKQFINKKSFLLPKEQHLTIPLREPLGMGMRFGAGGHLHQIQRLSSCTLVMSPKLWNCECLCQAYLSSKTPTCVPRDIRREKKCIILNEAGMVCPLPWSKSSLIICPSATLGFQLLEHDLLPPSMSTPSPPHVQRDLPPISFPS